MHTAIGFMILTIVATSPPPKAHDSFDWHTGGRFRQQLESTIGLTWSENPLRPAVTNLARSQRVAIFLDRRVDPSVRINLAVADGSLDQALRKLAGSLNLEVSYLDPVVYIGPSYVAIRLATVAANRREDVGRLKPAAQSPWLRVTSWSWQRLATPRDLINELARETGCRIVNVEEVPHDLWPAADLPPMQAADRLSLLLAGFSLTYELSQDGTAVRFISLPEEVSLQRFYRPQGDIPKAVQRLAETFPLTKVERFGLRLRVSGTHEDHEQIRRWLRAQTPRAQTPRRTNDPVDKKRFTLEIISVPAETVMKTVAKQLNLSLKVAPEVAAALEKRVSFRVEEVKLEELLHEALDPIHLRFRLEDGTLEIMSSEP